VIRDILKLTAGARLFDLSQPYFTGMPHYPTHPPFLYTLTKLHGESLFEGGGSSAADAIATGTHVGTHIDALCHFSANGRLHGGVDCSGVQAYASGVRHLSVDTVAPILRRGVLLDVAGQAGNESLPIDFSIGPEHLEAAADGITFEAGDVILIRTGWARFFHEPAKYIAGVKGPGPEIAGARWLSARKPFACGSDTVAFERVPSAAMPVHVHLLVESGIHIVEVLNLEELAAAGVREFVFVGAPLKIEGATGAPLRAFALA
jgi:kynurenine formamidase